jgi:beta-lactamase regulating signal transducer with metallopeptidase domain
MESEILIRLAGCTLALSGGIVVIMSLRHTLRRQLGAGLAYLGWVVVPMMLCGAMLPPAKSMAPPLVLPLATLYSRVHQDRMDTAGGPLWEQALLFLWLLGAIALAMHFLRQQRRFQFELGRLTEYDGIFHSEFMHGGPALVGIWHPKIVVPADFMQRYSQQEQRLIIAHERAHLQRGDAFVNLVCTLLQCLFWFNPLIYTAARMFRFDQELACDAAVMLYHPKSHSIYANAMMKTQLIDVGTPIGCHWQANHPLKERIMNLNQSYPNTARRIAGLAFVAALAFAGTYSAWAAQTPSVGDKSYEISLNLTDRFGPVTPVLLVQEKEEAVVQHGKGDKALIYKFHVEQVDAKSVLVKLVALQGKTELSHPRVRVELGKKATIETSADPDHDGDFKIVLSVTQADSAIKTK